MRSELYGEIEPIRSGFLQTDSVHKIYWEECGNPNGKAVLFLHGGPGAGISPSHRRFFDPQFYRIILFDQRGCGKSTPFGEISDNSTDHLIADIESLRRQLQIEQWLIFGGSWGVTLALAYGTTYPARCLGFILRGVFLARPSEIDWFLNGMRHFFPEVWSQFVATIPEAERSDLLSAYCQRLFHPDPRIHLPAAKAWSRYEFGCSHFTSNAVSPERSRNLTAFAPPQMTEEDDYASLALARMEAHYFHKDRFIHEESLLQRLASVNHLPATIIQGRYDIVCPMITAHEVACAWPKAVFTIIPDAGHSAQEPPIRAALVAATEQFKTIL